MVAVLDESISLADLFSSLIKVKRGRMQSISLLRVPEVEAEGILLLQGSLSSPEL